MLDPGHGGTASGTVHEHATVKAVEKVLTEPVGKVLDIYTQAI